MLIFSVVLNIHYLGRTKIAIDCVNRIILVQNVLLSDRSAKPYFLNGANPPTTHTLSYQTTRKQLVT